MEKHRPRMLWDQASDAIRITPQSFRTIRQLWMAGRHIAVDIRARRLFAETVT